MMAKEKKQKSESSKANEILFISKKEKDEMVEDEYFLARVILEIIGKPKEHIEKALKDYVVQLSKNDLYHLLEANFEEAIKLEGDKDMFSTFVEIEFFTKDLGDLMNFVIEYMPSSIEVLQPAGMNIQASFVSHMLTELAGKLHLVDGALKKVNAENQLMSKSLGIMIQNSILILLNLGPMPMSKISETVGVQESQCKVFLDKLVSDKKIKFDKDKKLYSLNVKK